MHSADIQNPPKTPWNKPNITSITTLILAATNSNNTSEGPVVFPIFHKPESLANQTSIP